MMWWLLIAILVGVFIWLLTLPSYYEVVRSRRVRVNQARAFEVVSDFAQWQHWSPWLIHDANTEQTLDRPREIGGFYHWKSAKIGEGRMTHLSITPNNLLQIELKFLKPFRTLSDVKFEFMPVKTEASEHCNITWQMHAPLPLPMRPFAGMFKNMVGKDFELGLAMLAGHLDPADSHPRIDFLGITELPSASVIRSPYEGSLEQMKHAMGGANGYAALKEKAGAAATGSAYAVYHKIKPMKDWVRCDFAVGVKEGTAQVSTIAGGRYFHTRLRGHYDYLPCAWNSATGQAKMCKYKWDGSRPALEVYPNDPQTVANSNDWVTEIYIPVK